MSRAKKDRKKSKFASVLRRLREEKAWTQSRLAGEAGISQVMIHKLESGVNEPGWQTVQDLAHALGVATDVMRG